MKKISFFLLASALFVLACNFSTPTNHMSFFGEEWLPVSEILCNGSGFGFGTCIAKKMKDSTCIGIARFNGSNIALEIPCNVMFQSAIDTIDLTNN